MIIWRQLQETPDVCGLHTKGPIPSAQICAAATYPIQDGGHSYMLHRPRDGWIHSRSRCSRHPNLLQGKAAVIIPQQATSSPAFTESLIGKTMEALILTPLSDILASPDTCEMGALKYPLTPIDFPYILRHFKNAVEVPFCQGTHLYKVRFLPILRYRILWSMSSSTPHNLQLQIISHNMQGIN